MWSLASPQLIITLCLLDWKLVFSIHGEFPLIILSYFNGICVGERVALLVQGVPMSQFRRYRTRGDNQVAFDAALNEGRVHVVI